MDSLGFLARISYWVADQGVVIPHSLGRCLGILTDFVLFSLKDKGQKYQEYGEDGNGYDG